MIRDRNVDWARTRIFRHSWEFPAWIANATGPVGSGTGAPDITEINAKFTAADLRATTDVLVDVVMLPYDLDETFKTYFRVYWSTTSTTTTDNLTWKLLYGQMSNAGAAAIGTTALDTALAQQTVTLGNIVTITGWGNIAANKPLAPGKLMTMHCDLHSTDATEAVFLIGYEMEYTPRRTPREVSAMVREARQRDDITY